MLKNANHASDATDISTLPVCRAAQEGLFGGGAHNNTTQKKKQLCNVPRPRGVPGPLTKKVTFSLRCQEKLAIFFNLDRAIIQEGVPYFWGIRLPCELKRTLAWCYVGRPGGNGRSTTIQFPFGFWDSRSAMETIHTGQISKHWPGC